MFSHFLCIVEGHYTLRIYVTQATTGSWKAIGRPHGTTPFIESADLTEFWD